MRARFLILTICLAALSGANGDAVVRRFRGLSAADDTTDFALRAAWKIDVASGGDLFTGKLRLGGSAFVLAGRFDANGNAQFDASGGSALKVKRAGMPKAFLSFSRVFGPGGIPRLEGTVVEQGSNRTAHLAAAAALYVAEANAPAPFVQTPIDLPGRYTLVFPPKTPAEQGRSADEYPQGYGIGTLVLSASGQATMVGRLADGSAVSCSAPVTKANAWPLWSVTDARQGGIVGQVVFRDRAGASDLDADSIAWFKPPSLDSLRYPGGWADGIQCGLAGSKYVTPPEVDHDSVFPGLGRTGSGGNAELELYNGALLSPFTKALNINARNLVAVPQPAADQVGVTVDPVTGLFWGNFIHDQSGLVTRLRGVVIQKQQRGFGFFLGLPAP